MNENNRSFNSFEATTMVVVKEILEKPNSVAAIQGTLRMSGLFAKKQCRDDNIIGGKSSSNQNNISSSPTRYINFEDEAATPTKLAQSMRIYTMFPQMPDPLPLPSTSAEELRQEIINRDSYMAKTGRNPHMDRHGRMYTHRSTSNVSNTIHGIYLTLDLSGVDGVNGDGESVVPPAFDLFGMKEIEREWVSLVDLKVLDDDGKRLSIGTKDTKSTFISGFIVRQLVKEGII